MRQTTLPEQTAKLIELGFKKPKSIISAMAYKEDFVSEPCLDCERAYSIGELIEMLGGVSGFEITRFGSGWGVYDELRAFTSKELIDALYDMIIMLKEGGGDMIQLFNCSCIKNVTLRIDSDKVIELEVSYLDDKENRWVYMKNISDIADKQYHKDKLANAYRTIKEALVGESRFVEIEV